MFSKTSPDEVPREMLALLVELLASAQLPELAIGGAWHAMYLCLTGRPELAKWAIEELGLRAVLDRRIGRAPAVGHT